MRWFVQFSGSHHCVYVFGVPSSIDGLYAATSAVLAAVLVPACVCFVHVHVCVLCVRVRECVRVCVHVSACVHVSVCVHVHVRCS
jgi:hypothetical protein